MPINRGTSFACNRCGTEGYRTEDEAKAHEATCSGQPAPAPFAAAAGPVPGGPAATVGGYPYQHPGSGAHHGYYGHYPPQQQPPPQYQYHQQGYHPTTQHPYQQPQYPADDAANLAAGNLSSMKKQPLETIVPDAKEGEEDDDEFGGLSARKLDQSFAEPGFSDRKKEAKTPSTQQQSTTTTTNNLPDGPPRAPTPLLLTPDQSLDGKARPSQTAKVTPSGGNEEGAEHMSPTSEATASSKLSELDAMTCHNIEAFQASAEDVAAFDPAALLADVLGDSTVRSISCGQVGFRCAHCFAPDRGTATTKSDLCVVYPASVGTISSSLRVMRDGHFPNCKAMPEESRKAFDDARTKQAEEDAASGRGDDDDKNSENGGPNDEWRRIAFLDFCVDFCSRKGIINMQPQRSGLKYGPIDRASSSPNDDSAEDDSTAGLNAAAAVLAMARPNVTPLTSKRDREEAAALVSAGQEGGGGGEAVAKGAEKGAAQPPGAATGVEPGPPNFPFFADGYGAWICRYCCSVPYPYRGPGSVWNDKNQAPPTQDFVDRHVNVCRGGYGPPPAQQGGPNPSGGRKTPSAPNTPHAPAMQPGAGGTTPKPTTASAGTPQSLYRASPQVGQSPHLPPLGGPPPVPFYGHHYPYPPPALPPPPPPHGLFFPYGRPAGPKPPRMPPQRRGKLTLTGQVPEKLAVPPGVDGSGSDSSVQAAIDHLVALEKEPTEGDAPVVELILDDDRLLLTDYFYHLIKQLRLVRFSEKDRKTRGGKREKVSIGYGGLECIHCTGTPGGRKFFWSNVDRLANSFAEIPGHILKCRLCPPQTKSALLELKIRHSAQMSKLPRGSQKVFFRRMWRRIHEDDPVPGQQTTVPNGSTMSTSKATANSSAVASAATAAAAATGPRGGRPPSGRKQKNNRNPEGEETNVPSDASGPPTSVEQSASQSLASLAGVMRTPIAPRASRSSLGGGPTDGVGGIVARSPIMGPHERLGGDDVEKVPFCTSENAAKALAHSAAAQSTGVNEDHPIIMLAIDEDKEWLSDNDCFVRRNIEVFTATEKDVLTAQADRKHSVKIGQVGIRCVHCAVAVSRYSDGKRGARGSAVSYPYSISGIYESVREFQRMHLASCPHLPDDVRAKLSGHKGSSSLSSVLRRYYIMFAKALGMVDTKEGIRSGGEIVALGSSAENEFATGGGTFPLTAAATRTPAKPVTAAAQSDHSSSSTTIYGGGAVDYNYPPPPPPHYGYQYNYGPPGAVHNSFLSSAITPLESRKRKAPRETPRSEHGSSKKPKTGDGPRIESV